MNPREFATIALKILAVYLFLEFLALLPTGLGILQIYDSFDGADSLGIDAQSGYGWMLAWTLIGLCLYLAVAVGLFTGASRIARWFVDRPDGPVPVPDTVPDVWLAAAFPCLGIYALITWLPDLVQLLVRCTLYGTWQSPQIPFLQRFYDNGSMLISPSIGVLLGLVLLFRAKGLLKLIQWARPMSPANPSLHQKEAALPPEPLPEPRKKRSGDGGSR